jgi:hypothetical protein
MRRSLSNPVVQELVRCASHRSSWRGLPRVARSLLAHVHLKGLERGESCEFGTGDVDLTPILSQPVHHEYTGDFTVGYEGPYDGTLRLSQSVRVPGQSQPLWADRQ